MMGPDALENLHEIPLPEPVSYAPETIGWYLLAALLGALALWAAARWFRSWRVNRYRRAALKELAAMERAGEFAELPVLLKRTALSFAPREQVAGLSGERWLEFLDRRRGTDTFTRGAGRLLPRLAYGVEPLSAAETRELAGAVRDWIRGHDARL